MSVVDFSGIRKIGDPVLRKEDARFLSGRGRYTDDIVLQGQVFVAFVRSPHAHARILGIDPTPALASGDVVAVYTGAQMLDDGIGPLPPIWQITSKDGSVMVEPPRYAMTAHIARHVGDIVALVIAISPSVARWAAEQVVVDYEPLPAIVMTGRALDADAPLVHEGTVNNLCFDWELGNREKTEAAFAAATHVVSIDLVNTRIVANPMEPRSAVAEYDRTADSYTLYTSSQNPHIVRTQLCQSVLHIPEQKMRVVAPDVGGGFGVKCYVYPEEALIVWAARKSGRAVKWTADRSESFVSDAHARDHVTTASLALDGEGTFLGLKVSTIANLGAYLSTWGPSIPTYLYAPNLAGQYATPAIYAEVKGVFTHTLPVDAYRGAGRPEASYVVERLVDIAAHDLGFDRAELRRRNFIKPTAMPYATPVAMVYDSGHFEKCFDSAVRMIDVAGFDVRRAESEARGKLRGLGFSCYIEACGLSPSRGLGSKGARIGLYESGQVRLNPDVAWHLIVRMRRLGSRLAPNCENHCCKILKLSASAMKLSTYYLGLSCSRWRQ
ncbi:xanthine dehydrogenase family protein molybdopterin-binding subunit [Ancylobacter sp. G4_0304]|uniref:xanthine dehydrogenase family protein molybdopterin-binding subunit n=1 Tax=Ancylobacter sp. G4_0304 TaxID=3114289 RepID=UPI0039C63008